MSHLTRDDLVLVAFGERPADTAAEGHLESCEHCRVEMDKLAHLMRLGKDADTVRDLPAPPERVWAAIEAQAIGGRPRRPIVQKAPWLRLAIVGAVTAVLAAFGTWLAVRPPTPPATPTIASARLNPFASAPAQAHGDASVSSDLRLTLSAVNLPPTGDGYYEVWLIDPDTLQMFSVGVLGADARLSISLPAGVDLAKYRLVDVSAESYDNQPAHSGTSLLRGILG